MNPITPEQIARINVYIDTILPQAGMTGEIRDKIAKFACLNSGIAELNDITEEQTNDLLGFLDGEQDRAFLVKYIEEAIAPKVETPAPVARPKILSGATADASTAASTSGNESLAEPAQMSFKQRALPLMVRGVPVTPVLPNTKRAFLDDWPTSATTNLAKIDEWNVQYPGYNCAAVANGHPDGTWFFETDSPAVWDRIKADTGHDFPQTYRVRSRDQRGHFYFENTPAALAMGNISQSYVKYGDWSARVVNQYVVGPFSIHPSTKLPYTPVDPDAKILPAPQWLIDWCISQKTEKAPTKGGEIPRDEKGLIPHGFIHGWQVTQAGRLRHMGLEVEQIETDLLALTHKFCAPPIDEAITRQVARSFGKYEAGGSKDIIFNQEPNQQTPAESAAPLITIMGDDFLVEKIPPRKVLISTISGDEPVIYEQSINQVFAWRGIGKTCLGMGFVRCLATGEPFLNFKSNGERVPVLYIEGELPDSQFQERWRSIVGKTDGYAHLCSIDKQPGHHYTSMATTEGMQKVEDELVRLAKEGVNIKVLMLDNISTLFNVKANEEEVWIPIQAWFTSLRSRGITVFFFHHAGKGGLSRSHSKSEDMLDVSIKMEEPEDPEIGHLHALMTFDKARAGLSEKPAEIKLHRTHSPKCRCGGSPGIMYCPGDGVYWEHIPKASKRDQAYQMFSEGRSITEVSDALEAPEGTVRMWRTKWGKAGGKAPKIGALGELVRGPK